MRPNSSQPSEIAQSNVLVTGTNTNINVNSSQTPIANAYTTGTDPFRTDNFTIGGQVYHNVRFRSNPTSTSTSEAILNNPSLEEEVIEEAPSRNGIDETFERYASLERMRESLNRAIRNSNINFSDSSQEKVEKETFRR